MASKSLPHITKTFLPLLLLWVAACENGKQTTTETTEQNPTTSETGDETSEFMCSDLDLSTCANQCVDLQTNRFHCGDCDDPCDSGSRCQQGECVPVCFNLQTKCGETCVDLEDDVMNCGSCGNACPVPEMGEAFCNRGQCAFTCTQGFIPSQDQTSCIPCSNEQVPPFEEHGLVALWRFNDPLTSNIVQDASGNNNQGEYREIIGRGYQGATSDGDTAILLGSPLSSRVEIIPFNNMPQEQISFEFWLQLFPNFYGSVFSYSVEYKDDVNNPVIKPFEFSLHHIPSLHIHIGNDQNRQTGVPIQPDLKWHHFVLTWENVEGTTALYIDGQKRWETKGFQTGYKLHPGGNFVIGQLQYYDVEAQTFILGDGNELAGGIDEFAIYNQVLTPAQVENHYQSAHCWP